MDRAKLYKSFTSGEAVYVFLGITAFTLPLDLNLNSYAVIATLLMWLIYLKGNNFRVKFNLKEILIHSFPFIIAVIGLLYTSNLDYGFKYISRLIGFLIFPLIFSTVQFSDKKYINILLVFIAGCLMYFFYVWLAFFEYDLGLVISGGYKKDMLLRFNKFFTDKENHPTYFSLFLIASIFISAYMIVKNKSKLKIVLLFILITILLALSLITLTAKMPISALLFIMIIVPLIYLIKNFKKRALTIYLASISAILIIGSIFFKDIPNRAVQEMYNYYNYFRGEDLKQYYSYDDLSVDYDTFWWEKTNRIVIWKNSIELMKDSPLIGFGTGDVQDELTKVYKKNKELWRMQFFNSHNQYLDYQLRYGILGIGFLLFMLFFYFRKAVISSDYLYASFIILVSLCFLTENIIQRHWGIIYFSFFNSLFYYRKRIIKKD